MPFVEIDLKQYQSNLRTILKIIGQKCELAVIVKSDAYGFGMEEISCAAYECGIRWFGIAVPEEAGTLRDIFRDKEINILLVSPFIPGQAQEILKHRTIPLISSLEEARALSSAASDQTKTSVHLAIDTGMGRLGFHAEEIMTDMEALLACPGLSIDGLFSHCPSADEEEDPFTPSQWSRFKNLAEKIEQILGRKLIKHIANSSVVFRYPEAHFDLVRCGIATYGARASSSVKFEGIESVMTVKSKVLLVKKIRQGQSISYGRTYTASEDRKVALIDMGYGEGLSRSLSSQGYVLIREKKVPILGRVTMDVTIVDVSSLPDVVPGDEAVIIGRQGHEVISVEEVASQAGTIPYEIFCVMGKILKKKYAK